RRVRHRRSLRVRTILAHRPLRPRPAGAVRRRAGRDGQGLTRMAIAWCAVLALVLGPVQAFNEGNKLYAQKDYAGAVQAYEQALQGGHDARAHYNLGNALFRTGKIGEAIANYRRAYYLAPRDRDVEANLTFARAYRVDKTTSPPGPLARLADRGLRWMSRREAALLAGLLLTLAGLALAGWIVWRVGALGFAALALGVLGLYGF